MRGSDASAARTASTGYAAAIEAVPRSHGSSFPRVIASAPAMPTPTSPIAPAPIITRTRRERTASSSRSIACMSGQRSSGIDREGAVAARRSSRPERGTTGRRAPVGGLSIASRIVVDRRAWERPHAEQRLPQRD